MDQLAADIVQQADVHGTGSIRCARRLQGAGVWFRGTPQPGSAPPLLCCCGARAPAPCACTPHASALHPIHPIQCPAAAASKSFLTLLCAFRASGNWLTPAHGSRRPTPSTALALAWAGACSTLPGACCAAIASGSSLPAAWVGGERAAARGRRKVPHRWRVGRLPSSPTAPPRCRAAPLLYWFLNVPLIYSLGAADVWLAKFCGATAGLAATFLMVPLTSLVLEALRRSRLMTRLFDFDANISSEWLPTFWSRQRCSCMARLLRRSLQCPKPGGCHRRSAGLAPAAACLAPGRCTSHLSCPRPHAQSTRCWAI